MLKNLIKISAVALISTTFFVADLKAADEVKKEPVYVIITHPIAEMAHWQKVFNEHTPAHDKAGLKLVGIYKGVENPNEITIIFEEDDIEMAKAFLNDPVTAENMKKAGVTGKPEIRYMHKVE